jgi:phospholipid/cholesterol/gamma-HCH transport system ATP-binding protein
MGNGHDTLWLSSAVGKNGKVFSFDIQQAALENTKKLLNLNGAENKFPGEISGGMQKRVAIARAIALNPKYLFCDEPNSGLDPKTSLVIDDLLHSITQEYHMTTIINTHDMNSVMGIGENIVFIYEGHKEWQGVSSEIMNSTNKRLTDFIFASDLLKEMRQAVTGQANHQ